MKFSAQIEKTDNGVVIKPMYSSDQEQLAKMKQNTDYRFEVKQPRNIGHHKKFFALLNLGFENQEQYKNFDHYRKVMVMKAGYFDAIETDKGTVYIPQSISFDKIDQSEFEDIYNKVLDVIAEDLDAAPQDIIDNVNLFM